MIDSSRKVPGTRCSVIPHLNYLTSQSCYLYNGPSDGYNLPSHGWLFVGPNNAGKSPSSLSEGKSWYEANSKKIQRMKPWWGQITVSIAKLVETCKFALAQGEGHCTLRTQILSIIQGLLSLNICYCYRSDSMSPSKYNRRTNLAKVLQAKAFLECLV